MKRMAYDTTQIQPQPPVDVGEGGTGKIEYDWNRNSVYPYRKVVNYNGGQRVTFVSLLEQYAADVND